MGEEESRNMTDTQSAVGTSIVVDAPVEHAFAVFTEDMDSWWPKEHHILQAPLARMVFEPKVGGAIYDVGTDGSECRWARVLAYEPPHRVVFSWAVSMQWQVETDPAKASEVEVRFVADGATRTLVQIEHRDRHGEGWESMRDAVGSDGGWNAGLGAFAQRLANEKEKVANGA
jgi:uncharacterized protein YndB with AHSA1/START domain